MSAQRSGAPAACVSTPQIDEYCLGMGSPSSLLRESLTIRKLVLTGLLQPMRLEGIELLEATEYDAGDSSAGSGFPPPSPTPPDLAVWGGAAPTSDGVADTSALERTPSVTALLHTVHASLGLPAAKSSGPVGVDAAWLAAEGRRLLKARFELQRVWVAVLADLTASGVGEDAAVAANILSGLVAGVATTSACWCTKGAAGSVGSDGEAASRGTVEELAEATVLCNVGTTDATLRAHCSATAHLVQLWRQGVALPRVGV